MAEANKPFVVTDRRKFTMEGDVRPDAERSTDERESAAAPEPPQPTGSPVSEPASATAPDGAGFEGDLPPAPTEEQTERSRDAYQQTTDRLDTAIRASNPGGDHPAPMTFQQMVQSIYMTAIVQLGGATPEGQQPQVDLLGARQSIDMLGLLFDKTAGNLAPDESRLLDSALFDARMAFLEITQALARSAAAKSPGGVPAGPSIVR